jgi:hypothetical protein
MSESGNFGRLNILRPAGRDWLIGRDFLFALSADSSHSI